MTETAKKSFMGICARLNSNGLLIVIIEICECKQPDYGQSVTILASKMFRYGFKELNNFKFVVNLRHLKLRRVFLNFLFYHFFWINAFLNYNYNL